MEHPRGTVAQMVHDFVDLERRVSQLEIAIRDGDARLKAAYTPTPKNPDMDEYIDRLNKLYEKLVAKRAAMNLTRTTDTEVTVEAGSVKVKTKPSAWSTAAPGVRVNPGPATPVGVTETTQQWFETSTMLTKVTWEDAVSGVKVTSVPCPELRDARYSAQNLYIVALAEHLESFKSTYWFTVDDFVRLRKTTTATHELCMRALHSTSTYERALAWLLNRDVKLKA